MRTNGAQEHCSPRRKAGAGELHLREELREEIPHLRACYEERCPVADRFAPTSTAFEANAGCSNGAPTKLPSSTTMLAGDASAGGS